MDPIKQFVSSQSKEELEQIIHGMLVMYTLCTGLMRTQGFDLLNSVKITATVNDFVPEKLKELDAAFNFLDRANAAVRDHVRSKKLSGDN